MVIVESSHEGKNEATKKEKTQKKIAKPPILFVSQNRATNLLLKINARIKF